MRGWIVGLLGCGLLLGQTACLDDTPVANGAPTVRATLSANVVGAIAGGTVRIRVGYRTSRQQFVALRSSPEAITVAAGTTVVLPVTVDIGPCLADDTRVSAGEPGCLLTIELTLADATGSVIDTQTRDAQTGPVTPGQSVDFGTVTVGITVSSVTVAPSSLGLNVSDQQQLTATVRDTKGVVITAVPVTWATSDATVAQLSGSLGGSVTVRALKLGTASVTATAGGKSSAPVVVNVAPPPPLTIRQQPGAGCVVVGQTVTLNVDSPPAAVAWAITNTGIATIGASTGVVTGVAVGQTTATATSGNRTGEAPICVVGPLRVSPTSVSINAGRTAQLTALNATGGTVSYVSNAPAIATVDASGLVRGVGIGQTTVVTTLTGASGSQSVSIPVSITAAAVTVSPSSASPPVNGTVRVTATVLDANGLPISGVPVTWSIGDPTIGSLSTTSGTFVDVRAIKVGSTTVRAAVDAATASAQFNATQPLPASRIVKIAGDGASCATGSAGCLFSVRALDVNGFPVAGASVGWSSSYCGGSKTSTTDDNGVASATNICTSPAGTYTQTAILSTTQSQVTFSYALAGLVLSLESIDSADVYTYVVRSSAGAAGGLTVRVNYLTGPATNYVQKLALAAATTPTTLTFDLDPFALPYGEYAFDIIVSTTTPGIGPGVVTVSFAGGPTFFTQPNVQTRRAATVPAPASRAP